MLLDNIGILLSGNQTKHIHVRYFLIKDIIAMGHLKVKYFLTGKMLANYFAKPCSDMRFRESWRTHQIQTCSGTY